MWVAVAARENEHGRVRERILGVWTVTFVLNELSDALEVAVASSDPDVFLLPHSGKRQAATNRIWEIWTPEWR